MCSVEESLSAKTARANGYLTLVDVISCACGVVVETQQYVDANSLVSFQDIVEDEVGLIEEQYASYCEQPDVEVVDEAGAEPFIYKIADKSCADDELNPYYVKWYDEL